MASEDFVRTPTAKWDVIVGATGVARPKPTRKELLWGDRVSVIGKGRTSGEVKVRARGQTGYVAKRDLGGEPLLEVYFIDVGQGDGMLIVTPDRRHILIDGGWPRRSQPSGKNAADFVDWKFARDYGRQRIALDSVICSHNDQDHYGGLWDLFNPDEHEELDIPTKDVTVEQFFHAGVSWWSVGGKRSLGRVTDTDEGPLLTDLVNGRASVVAALKSSAQPKLQGEWAQFLADALKIKTRQGTATPFTRLSHATPYLPGYERGSSDVAIRVLAPVEFNVGGRPGVRRFKGTDSKSTNGNSVLLRLDYKRSRLLLTGDLNTGSQVALMNDYVGERAEFQCDLAKACHHGSDDVSYAFLQLMEPAITVISSGDNEGHDHPRPAVVAASATTGHVKFVGDRLESPLIYSTELARSIKLGVPTELSTKSRSGPATTLTGAALAGADVTLAVTNAGDRRATKRTVNLGASRVVAGIIYGLVNVRTDGETILCATMNEARHTWEVRSIQSRF